MFTSFDPSYAAELHRERLREAEERRLAAEANRGRPSTYRLALRALEAYMSALLASLGVTSPEQRPA